MTTSTQVSVDFDDFLDASSYSPRNKGVAGARSDIPKDILLTADPDGILVETYSLSKLVIADKSWTINASVDATKLINICKTIKKLGASGDSISIDIVGRDLILKYKTTSLSIPTVWVK